METILALASAAGLDADLLARYGPSLLQGLGVTLTLVAVAVPLGFALAGPIAIARIEGGPATRMLAAGFTGLFRGTPVLCQLFLVYYGSGQFRHALADLGIWPVFRDAFWCAVITFTLNTAAYQAEILRGALRATPAGQTEAAQALGMGRFAIYRLVLGPQALVLALRPLGNELVLMIKASSVASVITVVDLTTATKRAFSGSLDFEVYLWAAAIYLVVVEIVRRVWNALEKAMTRRTRAA
ncbi:MAG: ABC transporter permease [Ancylobacter novellus]|uniref:ABC transporter permease n=1 Tax=Ancylobacter novellus TaxID=921 RepID=A0A2W5KTM6_ANCNO|nr:MAG: ABC transporter permease [Ancylobacter novellus]